MMRARIVEALRRAIAAVERVNGNGELVVRLREQLARFEQASDDMQLSDVTAELEREQARLAEADVAVVLEAAEAIGAIAYGATLMAEALPDDFGMAMVVEERENYSVLRVFYATDRAAEMEDGKLGFGGDRAAGGKLNYGECLISIPKVRKVGELQSPSIWRLEFRPDPNKHIVLLETLSREEAEFVKLVREAVEKSAAREAFVFIHGYNVSFENAARRTGQMAYDLEFQGAPILYSWPSNARTADYTRDEADVAWSAPHLERFLHLLGAETGAERIHIIAHSMGNRAACEALKGMARNPIAGLEFRHVILAAPDIDADTFAELAGMLKGISHRVTLYASANDKALMASKLVHGNSRAGQAGGRIVIVPEVDTIDATAIDTDFMAHSYFSDSWPLLADIHALIHDDKGPEGRFGLVEVRVAEGRYFAFREN